MIKKDSINIENQGVMSEDYRQVLFGRTKSQLKQAESDKLGRENSSRILHQGCFPASVDEDGRQENIFWGRSSSDQSIKMRKWVNRLSRAMLLGRTVSIYITLYIAPLCLAFTGITFWHLILPIDIFYLIYSVFRVTTREEKLPHLFTKSKRR